MKAVAFLQSKYHLLGYDMNKLYTHDLPYAAGELVGTPGPKTMCVAAQLEVIVTAMDIYARETGDRSVYSYLPIKSWKGTAANDIKGHIWVNQKFGSSGTADALNNFGMGELTTFENLRPGAFINFNRQKGTGHAVTFIAFIDRDGKEFKQYNSTVIGFKYFSAQGMHDPDGGGFDYRYGVFSQFNCPASVPDKRDCGIIFSHNGKTFNAGRMWAPRNWSHAGHRSFARDQVADLGETVFNSEIYDGVTDDH